MENEPMPILAGYMVPHPPLAVHEVGRGDGLKIQATLDAFDEVARDIAGLKPETIILASPHSIMYSDYFHISPGYSARGDFGNFRAGGVQLTVQYDRELVQAVCDKCDLLGFPAGTEGEKDHELDHGTMVPLYFINQRYRDYKLVRIGLSGLSLETHRIFGRIIASVVKKLGRRAVFVASGDLSHCQKADGPYGYKPDGPRYDERLMDVMGRGAFGELLDFDLGFLSRAEECGHRSFVIMAGAMEDVAEKEWPVTARILSHENTFGVGYGIGIFKPKPGRKTIIAEEKEMDAYVKLARQTIDTYIREGRIIEPPEDLPEEMKKTRAGAFVSIHEHGMLRGCIGTILATQDSVAQEIIMNAISASTRDPRFSRIRKEELPDLDINVDVLGDPEKISSPDELDVKKYGVIVTKGQRRGLLLPDLDNMK
ncbi:MAG: AmmeMemoRadiSam system protein A [Lachnospiraceae bacterium]|nr:AmmeMemoRadiSam system protein A [Lachnospiraceae bacterium]